MEGGGSETPDTTVEHSGGVVGFETLMKEGWRPAWKPRWNAHKGSYVDVVSSCPGVMVGQLSYWLGYWLWVFKCDRERIGHCGKSTTDSTRNLTSFPLPWAIVFNNCIFWYSIDFDLRSDSLTKEDWIVSNQTQGQINPTKPKFINKFAVLSGGFLGLPDHVLISTVTLNSHLSLEIASWKCFDIFLKHYITCITYA